LAKSKSPRVLAVIPARGGSKRLPRKNIMKIGEHPMIAYSIMAVRDAESVSDWLVSSDDDEIIHIAKKYGAETPFKRPPHLATDEVRNIEVVDHALEFMEKEKGYIYDIIILVQPTSPIRSSDHINQAVSKLWSSNLNSLASVKGPYQKRDPILKRINSEGELVAYNSEETQDQREPFFIYNASLYAVKRDYFINEKRFIADNQIPFIMDKYHSVDVDEIVDKLVAEVYLNQMNKG